MSWVLLKSTIRKNSFLVFLFIAVMLLYSVVMISMYNPESIEALNAMFLVLPKDFMKALGFNEAFSTLEGYLASWLYGLIMTAFPLVYCIIMGNHLIAASVDDGSMASLLSLPISRSKLLFTKILFALGSVAFIQMMVFGVNVLFTELLVKDNPLNIEMFFKLNFTVMLVNMCAMSITLFFSSIFNQSRLSLLGGSGVTLTFLLLNMLGNASDKAEVLKKISIYGWYNPVGITNGDPIGGLCMIYVGIILVLVVISILIFRKKQIPV